MKRFLSDNVPLWRIPDDMPKHLVLSHLDAVRATAVYYEQCNRVLINEIEGIAKQLQRRGFSYDELLEDYRKEPQS